MELRSILFALILLFATLSFADPTLEQRQSACATISSSQQCSLQKKAVDSGIVDNLILACKTTQQANGCEQLRTEISKSSGAAEAEKKMKSCNAGSVCEQSLDWKAMQLQCERGLKEGFQEFTKTAMKKALEAGNKFTTSAKDVWKCDNNHDGLKQKLYDDYNKTVPAFLSIHPPPGRWFEQATCGEIMRHLNGTNQNLIAKLDRRLNSFEQQNPRARTDLAQFKDPELLAYKVWLQENGEKQQAELAKTMEAIGKAFQAVPALLKRFDIRVNCYKEATKAEIVCHAATAAAATLVSGAVSTVATKALLLLARSSGSLTVAKAVLSIEKLEKTEAKLARAEIGSDKAIALEKKAREQKAIVLNKMSAMSGTKGDLERKQVAKALGMVKGKTEEEQKRMLQSVVDAHNVCDEGGFGGYSPDCLRKKAQILKKAGFDAGQRERLMRNGIAGKFADVPEPAVTSIRQASVYLFKKDLNSEQVTAVWNAFKLPSKAEKVQSLAAVGFTPDEIEKILSGELNQTVNKAKDIVLKEIVLSKVDAVVKSEAPAPVLAAPTSAIAEKQKELASRFEIQDGPKIQSAYDESRKAHLEEMTKNPDLYRKSPKRAIDGSISGLKPTEAADLIEGYVKDTGGGDASLMKMVEAIDQKSLSEASKSPIQSSFSQYKLQELKVELLERHYHAKYKDKFNEIDTDKFFDADEKGFEAFQKAKEDLETMRKKGAALRWPK